MHRRRNTRIIGCTSQCSRILIFHRLTCLSTILQKLCRLLSPLGPHSIRSCMWGRMQVTKNQFKKMKPGSTDTIPRLRWALSLALKTRNKPRSQYPLPISKLVKSNPSKRLQNQRNRWNPKRRYRRNSCLKRRENLNFSVRALSSSWHNDMMRPCRPYQTRNKSWGIVCRRLGVILQ